MDELALDNIRGLASQALCQESSKLPSVTPALPKSLSPSIQPQSLAVAYSFSEMSTSGHLQVWVTIWPLADARSLFYPFLQPRPIQILVISHLGHCHLFLLELPVNRLSPSSLSSM